jgi:phosphatidylserine/phosphatidylglycerophosphate/cardiolipin synthase-like enzyme
VFFNAPTGSRDLATYTGSIDLALIAQLNRVQNTIDIAAYEFNNPYITDAVVQARQRGVTVRVVTDDEAGFHDDSSTIAQLRAAGIPVVDDDRSALMHNKFMILDSTVLWTGSWNYTINDTYRNNNNAIAIRNPQIVANYQAEFDEMFVERQFGPRSPRNTPFPVVTADGIRMETYFAPEDDVITPMIAALSSAQDSIRFLTFSFTHEAVGNAVLERARAGVDVRGVFETTGSETTFSRLTSMFCAGLPVRQDSSSFILHHKVFIIDDHTVITGSFNISNNATNSNDENLMIITDPVLAQQFIAEFDRRYAEARVPQNLAC